MNTSSRYNPVKFLKDPKKQLLESQSNEGIENGDEGSTGGNTTSAFFGKEASRQIQSMNPDTTATSALYNSQMVTMRNGDVGARSSYLDTIKEESEARRTRFYK